MLDQETLLRLLRYEPETGKLFWLDRPDSDFINGKYSAARIAAMWRSRFLGKEAFTADSGAGYRQGTIYGKVYKAHRVIWKMLYGYDAVEIDHDDQNRSNNRKGNLFDRSRFQNMQNRKVSSNNRSGMHGVFQRETGKWVAQIGSGKGRKYLGQFVTIHEAKAARRTAELELNYHPNHGAKT